MPGNASYPAVYAAADARASAGLPIPGLAGESAYFRPLTEESTCRVKNGSVCETVPVYFHRLARAYIGSVESGSIGF